MPRAHQPEPDDDPESDDLLGMHDDPGQEDEDAHPISRHIPPRPAISRENLSRALTGRSLSPGNSLLEGCAASDERRPGPRHAPVLRVPEWGPSVEPPGFRHNHGKHGKRQKPPALCL
jgi:hypothetical protein